jgi:hypothetical protein
MTHSIFPTNYTKLVCNQPFAARRRRELSAQELSLLLVMIADEPAIL